MQADFINPFLQAAHDVLQSELGVEPQRGPLALQQSAYTTQDVTAMIGVTGRVGGIVLLSMSQKTACGIVGRMLGQDFPELDELAQSGIGELANVITGRAAVLLADAGFESSISPPAVISGHGTMISTLDVRRLVIPLETELGPIEIQVALKEIVAWQRAAA